ALPVHPLVVAYGQQEVELLGEQVLVVGERIPEQRKRLDEGSPTHHQFGPALREQVEGGELLEDPYRVVGTEDGDGWRQPDPLGDPGDGGEHGGRRGGGEIGPVVLADPVHLETDCL